MTSSAAASAVSLAWMMTDLSSWSRAFPPQDNAMTNALWPKFLHQTSDPLLSTLIYGHKLQGEPSTLRGFLWSFRKVAGSLCWFSGGWSSCSASFNPGQWWTVGAKTCTFVVFLKYLASVWKTLPIQESDTWSPAEQLACTISIINYESKFKNPLSTNDLGNSLWRTCMPVFPQDNKTSVNAVEQKKSPLR